MTETMKADVVVVGSGAGGSTVAGELAAQGLKVIVLEAGPQKFSPLGTHLRNVYSSEAELAKVGDVIYGEMLVNPSNEVAAFEAAPSWKVSHATGGMFALWMGNCPMPDDSELPDFMPRPDWQPYFERADALMHIDQQGGGSGAMFEALLARSRQALGPRPEGREIRPMPVAARRVDGVFKICAADDMLYRDGEPPNTLTVLPDLIATEVLMEGCKAVGARAKGRENSQEMIVSAGAVVVSGGTVGSPKLLKASKFEHRPALGGYIHEHACIGSRVTLKPEIRALIRNDEPVYSIWVPASGEMPWQNQLCRFTLSSDGTRLAPGLREVDTSDIFTFVKIDARPENSLNLSDTERDPFGLPQASPTYAHSHDDSKRIGLAMAEHFQIAAEVGEVNAGWTPSLYAAGGSTHFMGSCRWGAEDDGTSVVDRNGAVWGTKGLFVADNSVIGTPNSGNPTFMTVAQSLRTADRVMSA